MLSVKSSRERLKFCISPSMRERAILTSPASLTSRSTTSARTRSMALAVASGSAASAAATVAGLGLGRGFGVVAASGFHLGLRAVAQLLQHVAHAVEFAFQRVEKLRREMSRLDCGEDLRFHVVGQFAQSHGAGHAGAALDGVQRALQAVRGMAVGCIGPPGA